MPLFVLVTILVLVIVIVSLIVVTCLSESITKANESQEVIIIASPVVSTSMLTDIPASLVKEIAPAWLRLNNESHNIAKSSFEVSTRAGTSTVSVKKTVTVSLVFSITGGNWVILGQQEPKNKSAANARALN